MLLKFVTHPIVVFDLCLFLIVLAVCPYRWMPIPGCLNRPIWEGPWVRVLPIILLPSYQPRWGRRRHKNHAVKPMMLAGIDVLRRLLTVLGIVGLSMGQPIVRMSQCWVDTFRLSRWNYAIESVDISDLLGVPGFIDTSSQCHPLGHIDVIGISIEF